MYTHYTSAKHVQLMRPHPTYAEREYTCSRRLRVEHNSLSLSVSVCVSVSVYTLSLSLSRLHLQLTATHHLIPQVRKQALLMS